MTNVGEQGYDPPPADRKTVEDTSEHTEFIRGVRNEIYGEKSGLRTRMAQVERTTYIWKAGLIIAGILAGLCLVGSFMVLAALQVMDRL